MVTTKKTKLKNQFLDFIKNEDYYAAESLFASDIFDVEDQMEALSDEDFSKIESQWSAVNTGEDITTPFFILKKIYDHINFEDKSSIVDLGSGHGFPSILFGALNPSLNITGYDIVLEKVNGAKQSADRLNLCNIRFHSQDLSSSHFKMPIANYYYLFNPFNKEVADQIAAKLFSIAQKQKKAHKTFKILSLDGWDIQSFKEAGFKTESTLKEIGLEVLCV